MSIKPLSYLLGIIVSLTLIPNSTFAQVAGPKAALQVSPVLNEIAAQPGEEVSKDIQVTNLSNVPLPIKGYTLGFEAIDEYGGSNYPDQTDLDSVQHWFKLTPSDFILQPGLTQVVKIVIKVPQKTSPGGHYATLFFESLIPKSALSESSVFLASRIGALYFFVIGGDISQKGTISKFSTAGFYQSGPVKFDITFNDTGNVHLKPKSTLTIVNWKGREVYQTTDQGQTTLPEKSRSWVLAWDKIHLFGHYQATLSTSYNDGTAPQISQTSFWVFPIWQIILGIFLLFLIWLIFFKLRKRWGKALRVLITDRYPQDTKKPSRPFRIG